MAKKISQLGLAGNVAPNDLLSIVDISDPFMSPTGTNKRITAQTLGNFLPVTATGSSTARNINDRFADTVNVKDFGAVGDGVTNDTAAIQAAITFGAVNNKAVYLPSGDFICSNKITTSNGSLVVFGDGINVTKVIFTSTNGGFDFNLISQGANRPPEQLSFSNLTLESNAAVSSAALSATWSTYQPNAQGQVWINNLNITRKNDGTGSFVNAIQLNKCVVAHIKNVVIVGDDNRVSDVAINLIDCIGIQLFNVEVNRYNTAASINKVSALQTEGIVFNSCSLYDVCKGIYVNKAIAISIINTHININGPLVEYCISFTECQQSYIGDGCLFYTGGLESDPINQDCIKLLNSNNNIITSCAIWSVRPASSRFGLVLTNCSSNLITNNTFVSYPQSIFIASGVYNTITNNVLNTTSNNTITNSGTNTFITNNNNINTPIGSIRWGQASGAYSSGELSAGPNWGAYIRGYSGTSADVALISSGDKPILCIKDADNSAYPGNDNLYSLGTSARRWSVVYSATGTINTSDAREKTFLIIEDAEKLAALELKQNLRKFKFNAAIEEKGENARIHFGVSAQQVGEIITSHGLDPNKYGFYCYDEWDEVEELKDADENIIQEYRAAGSRYGIRYEELLSFIISAL